VRKEIDALRPIYDPVSHANVAAHISLTVPFPIAPEDHTCLEPARIAAIRYAPLVPFLANPGAALEIEPQAELDRLSRTLEAGQNIPGREPARESILGSHDDR
jgi:hypothetical protein